jgi:hypothetical protein
MKRIALILTACICAFAFGLANAQVSTTRTSAFDWQTQDKNGVKIQNYARFDTALIGCLNTPTCDRVAGGTYRVNRPITPPAPTTGSATLNWSAPTMRTNEHPVVASDIVGYTIYYGTSPTALTQSVTVGPVLTTTIPNLATGTWYFSITATALSEEVPRVNEESPRSSPASKIIG